MLDLEILEPFKFLFRFLGLDQSDSWRFLQRFYHFNTPTIADMSCSLEKYFPSRLENYY